MKYVGKAGIVLAFSACLFFSQAANKTALVQSAIVPGMGQLSAGGWHKYIGLGFMVAEVTAIHLTFNEISKTTSYQEQTKIYRDQYYVAHSYDEKLAIGEKWQVSFDNAKSGEGKIALWAVLAGCLWACNAVEAYMFVPGNNEPTALLHSNTKLPAVELSAGYETVGLRLTKAF